MATDFFHTGEVVDAVIAVLTGADTTLHTGGLPAAWFPDAQDTSAEAPLKGLEPGDCHDYQISDLPALSPTVWVRGLSTVPTGRAGTTGVVETEEMIRVLHFRHRKHCRDANGAIERNMARARYRYAKAINKALFHDPQKKLAVIAAAGTRTEVSLTCSDTNDAQVINCLFVGWDLGHVGGANPTEDVAWFIQRGGDSGLWAIACDLRVRIRTG